MLQVCLICKAIGWREHALCDSCRESLSRLRAPFVRDEGRLSIHSLFAWSLTSPRGFGWLVDSLKRQDDRLPWSDLALWMIHSFGPPGEAAFVPVPSQRPTNHALGLARSLSRLTGQPVQQALSLSGPRRAQKGMRRGDREGIQFERELWSFYTDQTTIIIVDDVVTTGATARAAYHTLGRPRKCQLWAILDRRPCGA